jgi:hypothetical protein
VYGSDTSVPYQLTAGKDQPRRSIPGHVGASSTAAQQSMVFRDSVKHVTQAVTVFATQVCLVLRMPCGCGSGPSSTAC